MSASSSGALFAAHRPAAPVIATTMQPATLLVIDYQIRCGGEHGEGRCNKLLAERAARPHTHVCPRCGYRNNAE